MEGRGEVYSWRIQKIPHLWWLVDKAFCQIFINQGIEA